MPALILTPRYTEDAQLLLLRGEESKECGEYRNGRKNSGEIASRVEDFSSSDVALTLVDERRQFYFVVCEVLNIRIESSLGSGQYRER